MGRTPLVDGAWPDMTFIHSSAADMDLSVMSVMFAAPHSDRQSLWPELLAATLRAGVRGHIAFDFAANVVRLGIPVAAFQVVQNALEPGVPVVSPALFAYGELPGSACPSCLSGPRSAGAWFSLLMGSVTEKSYALPRDSSWLMFHGATDPCARPRLNRSHRLC